MPHPEVVDWAEYGLEPVDLEPIFNLSDAEVSEEEVIHVSDDSSDTEDEEVIHVTDTDSNSEEVDVHDLPTDPWEPHEVIHVTDTDSDSEEVDVHDLPTDPWEPHVQEQYVSDTDSDPE